jgi:hypothetical protein
MTEKNTNKSSDLNKKARNAMFIVAVLNVISGYIFWLSYNGTGESLFLIAAIVLGLSSIVLVILTQTLMKKG